MSKKKKYTKEELKQMSRKSSDNVSSQKEKKMSAGKIAGIVFGVIGGVAILGLGGYVAYNFVMNKSNTTPDPNPTPTPAPNPTPTPTPDTPKEEEIKKSEELKEELKNDVADKKPEEFENNISNQQNELDKAQNELQNLKDSGASEEEIAAAEQKQQQLEEKLEEAKEEQSYWTVTSAIKDLYKENYGEDGSYVRNIKNIYRSGNTLGFECETINTDSNGLLTQNVVFIKIRSTSTADINKLEELKDFVDNKTSFKKTFEMSTRENSESKKELFDCFLNKFIFTDNEMTYNVVNESFDLDDNGNISKYYIIYQRISTNTLRNTTITASYDFSKADVRTDSELLEAFKNNDSAGILSSHYSAYSTKLNIDWQNATIEYKGQEAQAEASVEQFATRNEAGEMESFDYTAFRKAAEENKAEKQTIAETKQSNVLYDDLDFSL